MNQFNQVAIVTVLQVPRHVHQVRYRYLVVALEGGQRQPFILVVKRGYCSSNWVIGWLID